MKQFPYLCLFVIISIASPAHAQKNRSPRILWENKPATDWMTEAYPIGNGDLGAMIFGGVQQEHIQFNEKSLWTGDEEETGAYQAFGDVRIAFDAFSNRQVANYRRELDLTTAVHTITYNQDGISFKREYFASHPHNVIVLRYTASKLHAFSGVIMLSDAHNAQVTQKRNSLSANGQLNNSLRYSSGIYVKNKGGKISSSQQKGQHALRFNAVDTLTVYLAAATNYENDSSVQWRKGRATERLQKTLAGIKNSSYKRVRETHINDYEELFNRVQISLGNSPQQMNEPATSEWLLQNNQTSSKNSLPLQELLFQYGRYLLISSSREGGLPANLQGVWNNSNNPPWRSDYHSNINVQMNYWPAESTNLAECHLPYLEFLDFIRPVKKRLTREEFGDIRGWTLRTENNIFGGQSFSWNTPGSAWMSRALFEHYKFHADTSYLKHVAYPVLKEITQFWDDRLKVSENGKLVSPMGWSPEHGPVEDGVTHDQEIVYELFTNFIEASKILAVDKKYRQLIQKKRDSLLRPQVGRWGQLQEWAVDRDDPEDKHRHISHLYALHPGREISFFQDQQLANAAEVSLRARGDGSTGWAMAWKMNFWARLLNGEKAYRLLNNFLTPVGGDGINYNEGGGLYSNLLCAHPPFQIDGNFGYTAAVAEMLLQSQNDVIHFLPAIPKLWDKGSVSGLKARGNFLINELQWENREVKYAEITSFSGLFCTIRSPNQLSFQDEEQLPIEKTTETIQVSGKERTFYNYSFRTQPNESYVVKAK